MTAEVFLAPPSPLPALTVKKPTAAARDERAALPSFEETLKEQEKKQQADNTTLIPVVVPVAPQNNATDSGQAAAVKTSDSRPAGGTPAVQTETKSEGAERAVKAQGGRPAAATAPATKQAVKSGFDGALQQASNAQPAAGAESGQAQGTQAAPTGTTLQAVAGSGKIMMAPLAGAAPGGMSASLPVQVGTSPVETGASQPIQMPVTQTEAGVSQPLQVPATQTEVGASQPLPAAASQAEASANQPGQAATGSNVAQPTARPVITGDAPVVAAASPAPSAGPVESAVAPSSPQPSASPAVPAGATPAVPAQPPATNARNASRPAQPAAPAATQPAASADRAPVQTEAQPVEIRKDAKASADPATPPQAVSGEASAQPARAPAQGVIAQPVKAAAQAATSGPAVQEAKQDAVPPQPVKNTSGQASEGLAVQTSAEAPRSAPEALETPIASGKTAQPFAAASESMTPAAGQPGEASPIISASPAAAPAPEPAPQVETFRQASQKPAPPATSAPAPEAPQATPEQPPAMSQARMAQPGQAAEQASVGARDAAAVDGSGQPAPAQAKAQGPVAAAAQPASQPAQNVQANRTPETQPAAVQSADLAQRANQAAQGAPAGKRTNPSPAAQPVQDMPAANSVQAAPVEKNSPAPAASRMVDAQPQTMERTFQGSEAKPQAAEPNRPLIPQETPAAQDGSAQDRMSASPSGAPAQAGNASVVRESSQAASGDTLLASAAQTTQSAGLTAGQAAAPSPEVLKQAKDGAARVQGPRDGDASEPSAGAKVSADPGVSQAAGQKVSQASAKEKNAFANGEQTESDSPQKAAKKAGSAASSAADQPRFATEVQGIDRKMDIKVGKAETPVVQQVIEKIQEAVQQGRTALRMQLNPKDLGTIDIRLVSSGQSVSITMVTQHPSTGQMLEKQIDQLRANLADAGINLANVNIGQQAANGQQGSQHSARSTPERYTEGGRENNHPQPEPGSGPLNSRASTETRIDYRI